MTTEPKTADYRSTYDPILGEQMAEWQASKFSEIRDMFDLAGKGGWITPKDASPLDARTILLLCELLPDSINQLENIIKQVKPENLRNSLVLALHEFAEIARSSASYFPPKVIVERVARRHRAKVENQRLVQARADRSVNRDSVLNEAINVILGRRVAGEDRRTQGLTKGEIDDVLQLVRTALKTETNDKWPSRGTIQNHAKPLIELRK